MQQELCSKFINEKIMMQITKNNALRLYVKSFILTKLPKFGVLLNSCPINHVHKDRRRLMHCDAGWFPACSNAKLIILRKRDCNSTLCSLYNLLSEKLDFCLPCLVSFDLTSKPFELVLCYSEMISLDLSENFSRIFLLELWIIM